MNKFRRPLILFVFFLMCASFASAQVSDRAPKKVVMIIAHSDFRDDEFLEPVEVFEDNAIDIEVASTSLEEAVGMLGTKIKPDILIKDINPDNYDAIVLVGGVGAKEYWDDEVTKKLLQDAAAADKVVAAICIAPVTLANAGLLKGKRATSASTEVKKLEAQGAIYTGRGVEQDGNIVTASGPGVSRDFAEEIIKKLDAK